MNSFITSIGIANPPNRFEQLKIADFMANASIMDSKDQVKLQTLYRASGIKYRYSVIPDFGLSETEYQFFPTGNEPDLMPGTKARMEYYHQCALPLAKDAVDNCLEKVDSKENVKITHLITVSCTGMYAPGLDLELVQELGLPGNTQRTCINFMGCYAAFNALKTADAICQSDKEATVLVVCLELCTLHYQNSTQWDQILSNALFGDGAAACLVENQPRQGEGLQLKGFYCDIEPRGKEDMAWQITDFGFDMILSSYVPDLIGDGIEKLAERLKEQVANKTEKVDYYAIHPGGKRILEVIESKLGLSKHDNRFSYEVLQQYGNMSSATVLFVLEAIMQSLKNGDHGKNILSFAFGPGLTLESMMLEICHTSIQSNAIPHDQILANNHV
jgi:alpha-pyrone synthase